MVIKQLLKDYFFQSLKRGGGDVRSRKERQRMGVPHSMISSAQVSG